MIFYYYICLIWTGNSETKYYYKFRDMRKLFLLAIVLCVWSVVADAQESERRYIEVTGSSEIEVVPDEIHLLIQIKEYWKEEFVPKSKPEDYKTKVPLEWIEKDLRRYEVEREFRMRLFVCRKSETIGVRKEKNF